MKKSEKILSTALKANTFLGFRFDLWINLWYALQKRYGTADLSELTMRINLGD